MSRELRLHGTIFASAIGVRPRRWNDGVPFGLPIILIGAVVVIVIVMFGLAARDEDRWGDAW